MSDKMDMLLDNTFLCGIQNDDLQSLVLVVSLITPTGPLCDMVIYPAFVVQSPNNPTNFRNLDL